MRALHTRKPSSNKKKQKAAVVYVQSAVDIRTMRGRALRHPLTTHKRRQLRRFKLHRNRNNRNNRNRRIHRNQMCSNQRQPNGICPGSWMLPPSAWRCTIAVNNSDMLPVHG